ncbi:hypothetical protein PIB30_033481 [Stylosanthes scabra]|uniref:Uncharacterized protein n=1 Tax=Stylosanthes scabra TaxID=79078 RepID=A0ABU6XA50_9FABA|nr:hypothetical protein [Stylosanthes scabra]
MGPSKTRGGWSEDTIMVGATINVDYRKTTQTPTANSTASRGKGLAAMSHGHMNRSLKGQVMSGLGDPMGTPSVLSRSSQSGGSYSKIALRSVEDMKRSGKMKRGPTEPRPA